MEKVSKSERTQSEFNPKVQDNILDVFTELTDGLITTAVHVSISRKTGINLYYNVQDCIEAVKTLPIRVESELLLNRLREISETLQPIINPLVIAPRWQE